MASSKIFQTGAASLERSTALKPHGGWGDKSASALSDTKTGKVAFPWTTFSNKVTVNTTKDDSVTSNAFESTERLVGNLADMSLSMYAQYVQFDKFLYWYWGFEAKPQQVLVVRGTLAQDAPSFGDEFTDDQTNNYKYLRTEATRQLDQTVIFKYVFEATDSIVPSTPTGVMTNNTTIGNNILYVDSSPLLYEHLFELDKSGRQLRDFTPQELSNLGSYFLAGDKKSLFMTLAKKFETYDMRYSNSLAKGFSLKWAPAEKTAIDGGFLSFIQELSTSKGGFGSADWETPCDLGEGQMIPLHWQTSIFVSALDEDILELDLATKRYANEEAITDSELSFDVPLDNVQDTVSGTSLANPIMEDKYSISGSMTISRHASTKFQDHFKAQDLLKSYTRATQGWYSQETFVKQFVLGGAGPSDDAVASEPLEMKIGWNCDGDPFGTLLQSADGVSLEVNNSPVLMRTRNLSPYCQSTGRDLLGALETF